MQCIECMSAAVALCPRCQVGQCARHLAQSQQQSRRTGALAGCDHSSHTSSPARQPPR